MAYIRFSKENELYLFMSFEGLRIMLPNNVSDILIKDETGVGVEQAKALLRGAVDFLNANGYKIKQHNKTGKLEVKKKNMKD